MKIIALSFFLGIISVATYSQKIKSDSTIYVDYTDKFGNKKKALVVKPLQVLIVDGDSIYTVSNEMQLRKIIESRKGFDILNNSDSIGLFLRSRIKSIVILKKKKVD